MFSSDKWFGASADFYNGVATQSLRFNDGDSPYMEFDPASATAGTWTMSFWVKRTIVGVNQAIFSSGIVNARGHVTFNTNDQFQLQVFNSSGQAGYTYTDMKFRDVSAWYHIVVSANGITTSNIATNLTIYVNGVEAIRTTNVGSSATGGDRIGDAQAKRIGEYRPDSGSHFDGYLCDFNWVDGTALDQNDFGEFKNGVWIAKEPDVSDYGAGGWRLKFIGTGTSTSSGAVANPTNIGDDSSGKNNHWSVSGLASTDANLPDSPENNWCTMNSLINGFGTNITMSEGSLAGTGTSSEYNNTLGTFLMTSGKWYWEITSSDFNNYIMLGIAIETAIQTADSTPYGQTGVVCYATQGADYVETASGSASIYTDFLDSEIIGVAVDLDASPRTVKFYNNNTLQFTENLSSNFDDIGILPFFCIGTTDTIKVNFGQDSSFAGLKTAQGNQDENSLGDFYYTPPSGYLALCSSNLPEPTIGPNSDTQADDHFNTVTYTGNGSTQSITGVGFQPDWVWAKDRGAVVHHTLTDSSRGVHLDLFSSSTSQQSNDTNGLTAFDSDGFSLGSSTNHNVSSNTYVAWCWKANGGTTTTNDASATSIGNLDSVIQANTTAGFSIVTYTGQDSATTIAHGLGKKPAMIIVKQRTDSSTDWIIGHKEFATNAFANNKFFKFDTTAEIFTNSAVFGAEPDTDEIQLTTTTAGNLSAASKDFVAYCFAEVEGYSKFGSYNGNSSSDGAVVFTGFSPAFVMIRRTTGAASNWLIMDNARSPINIGATANCLAADSALSESSISTRGIDFLSNGFKIRTTAADMNTGDKLIYMAFAEAPFKYALGR